MPAGPLLQSKNGRVQELTPVLSGSEQSNSSIVFGDRFMMKLLRKVEAGVHPDWEVGRYLTEVAAFPHAPAVAGAVELKGAAPEPMLIALLHEHVTNEGTAWQQARNALGLYFEQVLAEPDPQHVLPLPSSPNLVEMAAGDIPQGVLERIGGYLSFAQLLGQRTAQMHHALAGGVDDPAFAPEPFTQLYQRSAYQSLRKLGWLALQLLQKRLETLPEGARQLAEQVLRRQPDVLNRFQAIQQSRIEAVRIRCHGDLHLGQVLFTGKDFVIIDFEGEPARPLGERRINRCALTDVAGMMRSFHYVSSAALFRYLENRAASPDEAGRLRSAASAWYQWTAAAFLKSYLANAGDAPFVPRSPPQLSMLSEVLLLEKAIYELKYELNNRPSWVEVPLRGILELLP
jgi:maltose alpha-D-glucosyltransferase/alpha-amylase